MRRTIEFVAAMHDNGVRLWVDCGKLHCRAAKGSLSFWQLETLRELKEDIIALLSPVQSCGPDALSISSTGLLDTMPLSLQQERTWRYFDKNASEDITIHWINSAWRLRGALKVDALQKAFDVMLRRHQSLRTSIVLAAGIPRQKIAEPGSARLDILQMEIDAFKKTNAEISQFIRSHFNQQRLSESCLFEAILLRGSENDHTLIIAISHFVSDGISIAIFFDELWVLYREFLTHDRCSSPEMRKQYVDYAIWQRRRQSYWLESQDSYWKRRLAGAEPVRLPVDSGLEHEKTLTVAGLEVSFGESLSSSLRNLSRKLRSTLERVLLSIYISLLASWSGQRKFVVGLIVDGRVRSEYARIIGYFSHSAPLMVELEGNESFMDLLQSVSNELLATQDNLESYQHLALDALNSGDIYSVNRTSRFNWLPGCPGESVVISRSSECEEDDKCLTMQALPMEGVSLKRECELELMFSDSPRGICAYGQYRADLFRRDTMQRLYNEFRCIAEHVVRNPRSRVLGLVRAV